MKTDKGVSVKACVRCAGQEMSWNPPMQLPLSIISLNSDFKSFYTNMFFISEIVLFFFFHFWILSGFPKFVVKQL